MRDRIHGCLMRCSRDALGATRYVIQQISADGFTDFYDPLLVDLSPEFEIEGFSPDELIKPDRYAPN